MKNQGESKGVISDRLRINKPELEAETTTGSSIPIDVWKNIKLAIRRILVSLLGASVLILIESFAIWHLWMYVMSASDASYWKTVAALIAIRLALRTSILGSQDSEKNKK